MFLLVYQQNSTETLLSLYPFQLHRVSRMSVGISHYHWAAYLGCIHIICSNRIFCKVCCVDTHMCLMKWDVFSEWLWFWGFEVLQAEFSWKLSVSVSIAWSWPDWPFSWTVEVLKWLKLDWTGEAQVAVQLDGGDDAWTYHRWCFTTLLSLLLLILAMPSSFTLILRLSENSAGLV